jgi:hypothetical protein
MKAEGSFLFSKEAATGPYPEPDESSPHNQTIFTEVHFNNIFPSTPRSSK